MSRMLCDIPGCRLHCLVDMRRDPEGKPELRFTEGFQGLVSKAEAKRFSETHAGPYLCTTCEKAYALGGGARKPEPATSPDPT